jgi:hypothetical protein
MEPEKQFKDLLTQVHRRVKDLSDLFKDDHTSVIFASIITYACKSNIKYSVYFDGSKSKEDIDKMMKEIFKDGH